MGDYLQGISAGGASIWEFNLGGGGCDYDGSVGILTQDCNTDWEDDGTEGRRQQMGVGLGGRVAGGNRALVNKGLHEVA